MRIRYLFALCCLMSVSGMVLAQNDTDPNVIVSDGKLSKRLFKVSNPTEDKTDLYDVTAIGNSTFMTSNIADGSSNSFKHSQTITVSLVTTATKGNQFQLVFYSNVNEIPYAAEVTGSVHSIYFPIDLYAEIKQKLEQSLAARKKAQVKLVQKKDGYREGSLVL